MAGRVTARIPASELREEWQRRLGVEDDPDAEIDITLSKVTGGVRGKAKRSGFLDARVKLGLTGAHAEERAAGLKSLRDEWDD